ncbi:MAG: major facilitator super transporter protein [Peltula sp. TS41687]|nr:MAG: major facilitator super transporter protein [Peltula sp. TS41687]
MQRRFLLFVANLLLPIAIITFAIGFFPYKPFLPGLANFEDLDVGPPPAAPFNKIILMVVDALRSDFVYSHSSGFQFVHGLISTGAAMPFTAHATSPTITMPRVKAITTGSIPSFLDVILNFAESDTTSTLANQDTWLAQMKRKGDGKLVMYGDDTWLKLFPDTFSCSDGTSSFFVSDFTEVDNNVTRHLSCELRSPEWNTLIMHYLGLDHIGHKAGPRSPNMLPKQEEMDGIVKQIYEAIEREEHLASTLLVLCGDHGMNDAGNHGGSSPGETSPALVFISPKMREISRGKPCPNAAQQEYLFYDFVQQSDIVPTLAGLLGFPTPRNNLGVFIPQLLEFWPKDHERISLLERNARQILNIVNVTFPEIKSEILDCSNAVSDIHQLSCNWKRTSQLLKQREKDGSADTPDLDRALLEVSTQAQKVMSSTASNYNLYMLAYGIIITALSVLMASIGSLSVIAKSPASFLGFIMITLLYGIMMFASSFVEEEHQFWSHTADGGQKLAGEPDIAKTFFYSHYIILWVATITTYVNMSSRLSERLSRTSSSLLASGIVNSITWPAFTFKVTYTYTEAPELLQGFPQAIIQAFIRPSLLFQARAVFLETLLALIYGLLMEWRHRAGRKEKNIAGSAWLFHEILTLFLVTQTRVTNIPLFLIFQLQLNVLLSLSLNEIEITILSLLFQHVSFFAFGGSNSIASIDLSNAYNGISGYNVVAVGILTFVSNWAGSIWWASATNLLLLRKYRDGHHQILFNHLVLLTLFTTASLFFVMVACTALRSHLFIWTVFSPKYLYSMAWCLGQHLTVNVICGSFLFWLGL